MIAQRFRHAATLLFALALFAPATGCSKLSSLTKKMKAGNSVLAKVETFKAPPMESGSMGEPYDHIKKSLELKAMGGNPPGSANLKPLPPTLVDTLLADFRTIAFFDLGTRLDAATIGAADVQKIVDFCANTSWMKLRGYRPWTHKKFIDSLTVVERQTLAKEAAEYLNKNGFLGYDSLPTTDPPPVREPGETVATPTPTPASGAIVFAGTYSGKWGPIYLEQAAATPNLVTGRYAKGTLFCLASGSSLACSWREGSSKGRSVYRRSESGDMTGTWGNGTSATSGGSWNLTRTRVGTLK